jgi:hypothetical protein
MLMVAMVAAGLGAFVVAALVRLAALSALPPAAAG